MHVKKLALTAFVLGVLAVSPAPFAQEDAEAPGPMEEELISLDFNNVDIRLVIKLQPPCLIALW